MLNSGHVYNFRNVRPFLTRKTETLLAPIPPATARNVDSPSRRRDSSSVENCDPSQVIRALTVLKLAQTRDGIVAGDGHKKI